MDYINLTQYRVTINDMMHFKVLAPAKKIADLTDKMFSTQTYLFGRYTIPVPRQKVRNLPKLKPNTLFIVDEQIMNTYYDRVDLIGVYPNGDVKLFNGHIVGKAQKE